MITRTMLCSIAVSRLDVPRIGVTDRPLQTFFAQVFYRTDEEPNEGEALIWLGTEPGELLTPEAAIAVIEPHVVVPPDLLLRLAADKLVAGAKAEGRQRAGSDGSRSGTMH